MAGREERETRGVRREDERKDMVKRIEKRAHVKQKMHTHTHTHTHEHTHRQHNTINLTSKSQTLKKKFSVIFLETDAMGMAPVCGVRMRKYGYIMWRTLDRGLQLT